MILAGSAAAAVVDLAQHNVFLLNNAFDGFVHAVLTCPLSFHNSSAEESGRNAQLSTCSPLTFIGSVQASTIDSRYAHRQKINAGI